VSSRDPGNGEPPAPDPGDPMFHLVPPPWVVVAEFDAPADQPELGWAVRELVMEGLDMTGGVAPVPNRELGATLRMAGLPDTARVDRARARELALRAGLPAALTGSVFRLGNGYAIRANAQNPEDGHVLVSVLERSADQDGLMGAAERLANRLASELAESVGTQQQVRPATLLTTSSFDAYEQYLRWLRANRERMDPAEQRGILRQALDIDPQFAMAWRALALHHRYYNPRNQPDSARAALDRAMALRNQVTDLERLHIEAVEAYIIQGWEGDDALIDIYGRILSINPRDESALNNRALALRRQGRRAEAVEHDRALLALFPETEAVRNIGARFSSLMFVGQLEEAKNLLPRLPGESGRLQGEARIALASHEWAVAERLALSWRHHRTIWASDAWWLTLAAVRAARGSVRAADSLLKVLPPRHVNNRLVLALATGCDLALGRPLPAPEDCSDDGSNWQQRGVETEHSWNAVIPTVMGHQDLVADWRPAVTAALSNFSPHVGAFHNRLLSALEHAVSGNWRAVTETVQSLDNPREVGLSGTTALRWLAGDAYERLGQLDSAAVYFHRVADSANFLQGEYDLRGFTYPFAQRRLAFIYAGMGDRSRAEHHWDVFRNTFTDPDPELRWLLEESPLRRRLLPGRARERAIAGGGLFSDSDRACASIEAGRVASFERALVATAEWFEGYLAEHGRYPTSGAPGLPEEIGRLGNLLIMTEGDEAGWIATAVDFRDTRICRLGGGEGPGAAEGDRSGEMTCFQHTHDEAHPQIGPLLAMGETFNRLLEDVRWWLVWSSTRPGFDAFPPQLTARGAPGQDGLPKPGDLYANWAYPEVRIEILQADSSELRALATHPNSPVRCTLRVTDDLHVFLGCSTPGSVPPGGG
jgi:tetratricopeptide (TPR) repeat protein